MIGEVLRRFRHLGRRNPEAPQSTAHTLQSGRLAYAEGLMFEAYGFKGERTLPDGTTLAPTCYLKAWTAGDETGKQNALTWEGNQGSRLSVTGNKLVTVTGFGEKKELHKGIEVVIPYVTISITPSR